MEFWEWFWPTCKKTFPNVIPQDVNALHIYNEGTLINIPLLQICFIMFDFYF